MMKVWITWACFVAQCVTLGTLPIGKPATPNIERIRARFDTAVMSAQLTGMEALRARINMAEASTAYLRKDSVVPEILIYQKKK